MGQVAIDARGFHLQRPLARRIGVEAQINERDVDFASAVRGPSFPPRLPEAFFRIAVAVMLKRVKGSVLDRLIVWRGGGHPIDRIDLVGQRPPRVGHDTVLADVV